jgi:hypothetical protein
MKPSSGVNPPIPSMIRSPVCANLLTLGKRRGLFGGVRRPSAAGFEFTATVGHTRLVVSPQTLWGIQSEQHSTGLGG